MKPQMITALTLATLVTVCSLGTLSEHAPSPSLSAEAPPPLVSSREEARSAREAPPPAPPPPVADHEPWPDQFDTAGASPRDEPPTKSADTREPPRRKRPPRKPAEQPLDFDLSQHAPPPAHRERRAEASEPAEPLVMRPLPTNSLYVRRSTAYGTAQTTGIQDQIEQGSLIDQIDIRFDDFMHTVYTGMRSPAPGEGAAVSYGVAEIPANLRRGSRSTHYVELAIHAGDPADTCASPAAEVPINYVFSIDVSGSMCSDGKLAGAKASIIAAYRELHPHDSLGLVTFDDRVNTLLPSRKLSALPPAELAILLGSITCQGGTDLNLGLAFAIDEISRVANPRSANRVVLFSDGRPTSGETDWVKIRRNATRNARDNIAIYTFAFGPDADLRELEALAGGTGGEHAFIADPLDAGKLLREGVARRSLLAALNIQARLDLARGVRMWHFYGHSPVADPLTTKQLSADLEGAKQEIRARGGSVNRELVDGVAGIRLGVPDLAVGETYWIVLEVETGDPRHLGSATLSYFDAVAGVPRMVELSLGDKGTLASAVVHEHAISLRTSEVMFQALDDLHDQHRDQATNRLEHYSTFLADAAGTLGSSKLASDRITLRKLLSLTQNLDKQTVEADTPDARATLYALSNFGRINNGHVRLY